MTATPDPITKALDAANAALPHIGPNARPLLAAALPAAREELARWSREMFDLAEQVAFKNMELTILCDERDRLRSELALAHQRNDAADAIVGDLQKEIARLRSELAAARAILALFTAPSDAGEKK